MSCHLTIFDYVIYLLLIYPNELEVKDIANTAYLDLHLEIHKGRGLKIKLYNKRDDFTFPIVDYLFIRSNIPASPAYGIYISPLIHYSRACAEYSELSC